MIENWVDGSPAELGWYAVLVCYDPHEGYSPSAKRWNGGNGKEWIFVTHRSPDPFASAQDAEAWAYAHDPDW